MQIRSDAYDARQQPSAHGLPAEAKRVFCGFQYIWRIPKPSSQAGRANHSRHVGGSRGDVVAFADTIRTCALRKCTRWASHSKLLPRCVNRKFPVQRQQQAATSMEAYGGSASDEPKAAIARLGANGERPWRSGQPLSAGALPTRNETRGQFGGLQVYSTRVQTDYRAIHRKESASPLSRSMDVSRPCFDPAKTKTFCIV